MTWRSCSRARSGTLGLIAIDLRAPAPAARADRDGRWSTLRRPGRAAARGRSSSRGARWRPTASTSSGRTAPGRMLLQFSGAAARASRPSRVGRRRRTSTGTTVRALQRGRRRRAEGLRPPDRPAERDPRRAATRPSSRAPRSGSRGSRSRPATTSRARRDGPPGARAAPLHGARRRRAGRRRGPTPARPGRDGAPEGALRPGPDLPSGRLRGRNMSAAWDTRAAIRPSWT